MEYMENVSQIIGERIRCIRTGKHMTQETLSSKANLHPTTIGQLERGEKKPSITTLWSIISALGVTFSEFFEPIDMAYLKTPDHSPAMSCYEWMQEKTTDHQERILRILKEIDGFIN